ncbi:DoxX family protein [Natrinema halophilum]|uniref:DoxX family protein n=1 Tax=Natrinema halophilum TaxID=1699371 RepID=A0A7D5KDM5_9EURY|nr:DoxX family protein [Natrinema halophilum]QLG49556.1 DoxX family protein [Natrinema halophilum]
MSVLSTALVVAQGVLALAMGAAGSAKVTGSESQIQDFERFGYPRWFRLATGGIELTAGIGLATSLFVASVLAIPGSLLVVGTMSGAILTHVRVNDSAGDIAPPAILLAVALVVLWVHSGVSM